VLGKALKDAVPGGLLLRNPAADISPPRVPDVEMRILGAEKIAAVLEAMADTPIFAAVITLMATGLRRGELMGLQWGDVNLDAGRLEIRRAVEKTKAHGLQLKPPKTKRGRRGITLPAYAVEVLKQHRTKQLATRFALGIGKLPMDAFVFGNVDGTIRDPDRMTQDWKRFTAVRKLPRVTLHGLRHTHASALLASGIDVVKASHHLGHASPKVTLQVYAHLFSDDDTDAAAVAERIIRRTSPGTK
jgi:integrase